MKQKPFSRSIINHIHLKYNFQVLTPSIASIIGPIKPISYTSILLVFVRNHFHVKLTDLKKLKSEECQEVTVVEDLHFYQRVIIFSLL